MIIGYLIFHPYTMLVYSLMGIPDGEKPHLQLRNISGIFRTALNPEMLPMAFSFAFFGGTIGLLTGILVDRKKRLYEAENENEKKKVALETLKRLMITLSHHLLNANTVIGGIARLLRRDKPDNTVSESLEVIEKQSKKIDAVIKALQELTEIRTADYTSKGKDLIIDITKEIEELLNRAPEDEGRTKK